tara:strand:+ start:675 stop:1400 length:726 start_codon:yes stop_codon:yes gene_type:complete
MKKLSIIRLIPNIFTFLSLTLGLTSLKFALENKWEMSVSLIVFASFLDNIDGKLARLLKSNSNFGVELDSLSDFLSFGIAPALIVYFWTMSINLDNSWAFVIFYSICSSSRLAKFNTSALDENKKVEQKYFKGISTPAAAGLVLLPMMLHFRFQNEMFLHPILSASVLVISGIFMISNIPSFSLKGFKLEKSILPFLILIFASFLSLLITDFWLAMILFICSYFLTIPLAFFKWKARDTDP